MNRLLIITGPTGSGKTALGVSLAKAFNGEIVSADSRQAYRYLDFGTGKDISPDSHFKLGNDRFPQRNLDHEYGYHTINTIPIWGLDIVDPTYNFNVSDYKHYANQVITDIINRGKLPIVVGGTGLYIRALIEQFDTLDSPKNETLRQSLQDLPIEKLQAILETLNPSKLSNLNASDRKNSRRLIRAIELFSPDNQIKKSNTLPLFNGLLFVLTAPTAFLSEKIKSRERGDLEAEVASLITKGYTFDLQSMTALVYREFKSSNDLSAILERWNILDRQYVKKQLTFFKKFFPENQSSSLITKWVDITAPSWSSQVSKLVSKWYTRA